MGEAIELTSSKYLAGPLIVETTGPRCPVSRWPFSRNLVLSWPWTDFTILKKTLGLVLVKGGPDLRAFVTQVQTTFVDALPDPSRKVRLLEAILALSLLVPPPTRVDPLIKELVSRSLGKNLNAKRQCSGSESNRIAQGTVAFEKSGAKARLLASVSSALEASTESYQRTERWYS
jgi:hypothetical protein